MLLLLDKSTLDEVLAGASFGRAWGHERYLAELTGALRSDLIAMQASLRVFDLWSVVCGVGVSTAGRAHDFLTQVLLTHGGLLLATGLISRSVY